MTGETERPQGKRGEAPKARRGGEEPTAASETGRSGASDLMERALSPENRKKALARVRRNKGSPGMDGMETEALPAYLDAHWNRLESELLAGRYQPQPVKRVEIPKPGGGMRQLGIPTVLDRFIQQALLQALQPQIDPSFSSQSYGFRPGRSAHDAICQAQRYIQEGRRWVVDVDLEKFFDRVNHDMLMARVARVVKDKRVLKLIRAYLNSGVMINGVVMETEEGTPQGGPLSPLLSNIMLDDLDKELEQRGHRFVRYADDCNIYVKTQRAGERAMESVKQFLEKKLKLKVNPKKSKVDRATRVKFLGFSFYKRKGEMLIRVASRSLERLSEKLRRLTKRTRSGELGVIIQEINVYTMGWIGYYRQANTPSVYEGLDSWIRRRLRQMIWKRWKRGTTRYRELIRLGVPKGRAGLGAVGKSPWHMAASPVVNEALSNGYFRSLGLRSIKTRYQELCLSG